MQRIKFIKNYLKYKSGDVIVVDNNSAFGLIDKKLAVLSKEDKQMVFSDDKDSKIIRTK